MAASATERRVYQWHIGLSTKPSEAAAKVSLSMDEVVGILESEWSAKRARVLMSKTNSKFLDVDDPQADPKNQIYIADIERDDDTGTVTLLMNRGDPDAIGPAYIEIEANAVAGKIRSTQATAKETPGWSAHLVVAIGGTHRRYRACFESMPKVSTSLVERAINRIISNAIHNNPHYKFEHVSKAKGKTRLSHKPYVPIISADRVPTESAAGDLKNAELAQVTFTRRLAQYSGVGPPEVIDYVEEKLVVHTKPVDEIALVRGLKTILTQAKDEGFTKVTFGINKLPGNATSNPTLDLDTEDALEKLYVRAKRLEGFEEVLLSCYPSINQLIKKRMISVVTDDGNW